MSDPQTPKPEKANPFEAVPIEVTVSVGRARPLIRDLLNMGKTPC